MTQRTSQLNIKKKIENMTTATTTTASIVAKSSPTNNYRELYCKVWLE